MRGGRWTAAVPDSLRQAVPADSLQIEAERRRNFGGSSADWSGRELCGISADSLRIGRRKIGADFGGYAADRGGRIIVRKFGG